jgi:hypothetical protein
MAAPAVADTERIDAYDAISAVLGLYIEGASQGDGDKLREAFHPEARMWGALGDERFDIPITEFFPMVVDAPANSDGRYRGRVLSVTQVGDTAVGHVAEDGYWGTMSFAATFSLARIEGRWWIVNKLFALTGGQPPA